MRRGRGGRKEDEGGEKREHTVLVGRLGLTTIASLDATDSVAVDDLLRREVHC